LRFPNSKKLLGYNEQTTKVDIFSNPSKQQEISKADVPFTRRPFFQNICHGPVGKYASFYEHENDFLECSTSRLYRLFDIMSSFYVIYNNLSFSRYAG